MDQLANALYGKRRPCLIAFGTLDRHQLCPFIDRFSDIIIVKITVFQKVYLAVGDTVFGQRTGLWADSNDALKGIIRFSHR